MSKDIKNYIHYYMGRPYWTSNSQGELNAYTLQYVLEMIKGGKEVQLHLRRLEDMTEEEKKALFQGVSLISLSDYDFEYGEDEDSWFVNAIGAWGAVQDSIQWKQGVLWAQNNDKSLSPINPQSDVFHYLLSLGFDLFGLIPAGFAIDSATLTNK